LEESTLKNRNQLTTPNNFMVSRHLCLFDRSKEPQEKKHRKKKVKMGEGRKEETKAEWQEFDSRLSFCDFFSPAQPGWLRFPAKSLLKQTEVSKLRI
jgi:hypothetical protein